VKLLPVVLAACLGLTGCATIKGWFTSSSPEEVQAAPASLPVPVVEAPPAEEPALRAPAPEPVAPPRAVPAPPEPRRPLPSAPRPPAPPPPPQRVTPEPAPPVLSPVLSAVDEQKLRADTQQRIDRTTQRLRQIDPAKLASADQDSLQTVQSFLEKAREALQAQDIQRAFTLADKAYLLADELTKR
jgi:type IV secretory pathway VirB10-like protein